MEVNWYVMLKPTGSITLLRIVRNNKIYTDKTDICEQFNQHFITIGPQLASTLPQNSENPMQFIKKTPDSLNMAIDNKQITCGIFLTSERYL